MKHAAWGLAVMVAVGCAQVREISGGEKDERPPQLVAAVPPAFSTGFRGDRITLVFDERVQLDRVRDRLLVSPPLAATPNVRVAGGRQVVLEFNAPLKANTTYTFAMGEVVKDLTEGNLAAGLNYVISTGDRLDSLQVMGRVLNAFTGKPEKDLLVTLYTTEDTLTVRNGRPAYATRSLADGTFALGHLRAGSYRIHALRDQNGNFRYDLPNEEIAFHDTPLVLEDTVGETPQVTLHLFRAISPVQGLRESKVTADGALQVALARPAAQLEVRDILRSGGSLTWTPVWSATRDTVLLWPSDTTALAEGRYALRADSVTMDTVRYRPLERMPFTPQVRATMRAAATGGNVELKLSRPVAQVDATRISLLQDSLPLPFQMEQDSLDPRIVRLRTAMGPGVSATLVLAPKALTDRYGGTTDSLQTTVGQASPKQTGTLRIRLEEKAERIHPALVQLLDKQGRVVQEGRLPPGERSLRWEQLAPGDHSLKLILDRNDNGRWDTGDLDQDLQPEPVIAYPDPLNIRAAWDITLDLRVD